MARFLAVLGEKTSQAHCKLAEGALKSVAARAGHAMRIEHASTDLSVLRAEPDELVLLADCDKRMEAHFATHPKTVRLAVGRIILETGKILEELSGVAAPSSSSEVPNAAVTAAPEPAKAVPHIVAVTSCPTGIAHTFMAAAALRNGAAELGYVIKVETRGSVGAQNALTDEEIAAADIALVAADTHVDLDRFQGVRLFTASTKEAIHDPKALILRALREAGKPTASATESVKSNQPAVRERTGAYKHLMTA